MVTNGTAGVRRGVGAVGTGRAGANGLGRSTTVGTRGVVGGAPGQGAAAGQQQQQTNQEGRIGEVEMVLKNMHEMMMQE